jgi:HEAT repeat protein
MAQNDPPPDGAVLDQAFEALKTYDAGSSRGVLMPLDQAVRAALGNAKASQPLEQRLVGLLSAPTPVAAKEYVCAKLALIGSAASVAGLAGLLEDSAVAHAARSTLETLPGPEATKALRDRLPRLEGLLKVGVIQSLGVRRDAAALPLLAAGLKSGDARTVSAAAAALGGIGTPKAAQTLQAFLPKTPEAARAAVADACLACAEQLLAAGETKPATALCEALDKSDPPVHVRQAARRLLSATAPRKS